MEDEQALWAEALSGNGRAFAALFRLHERRVFRQALRVLAEPADAEDAAAAAFFELWRNRARVRIVNGSVLPWLLVTVTQLARNGARSVMRREVLLRRIQHDRTTTNTEDIHDQADRAALVTALKRLRPTDAALVSLTALEGYKTGEIAAALGISEGAARVRLSRARHRPGDRPHPPSQRSRARRGGSMTKHGITPQYREQIAAALTELVHTSPTDQPTRARKPHPPRRATWITAAVALALLPLLVIAIVTPLRDRAITASGRSGALPVCSSATVAPFDCHTYLLTPGEPDAASSAIQNATAWFEADPRGQVVMTIEIDNRWIQVPVTRQSDTTAAGAAIRDGLAGRLDCTPDSSCSFRADVGTLFGTATTFTVTKTGFTVTNGDTTYTGTKTKTIHRQVIVSTQQRNSRTLLTYKPTNGLSALAFQGSDLGVSRTGCITAGDTVLVLPDTAKLNDDGSITFQNRRLQPGQPVNLGGGIGPLPANTPCGLDVDYWWAGTQ